MKEIKNKQYDLNGSMLFRDTFCPVVPMIVTVTNDKLGCTVSIACEAVDMQFSVPFDKMLKDLEEQ